MERQQDRLRRLRLRRPLPYPKGAPQSLYRGQPQLRLWTLKGGAQAPVHPRRRLDLSRRLQSPKASLHQRDLPSPTSPRWSSSCAWRIGASRTSSWRGRSRSRSFKTTSVLSVVVPQPTGHTVKCRLVVDSWRPRVMFSCCSR